MTLPLSDVVILDLTHVASGPWGTQLLADLGATVLKVERPGKGDDSRSFRPALSNADGRETGDSAFFLSVNRGKQSLAIDITRPEGAALVRRLAGGADAMIENYRVGTLKRFGLDYPTIKPLNPSIVYCSVTGFGQTGPDAQRPAYDSILQAAAGLMSLCGEPDGPPTRTAIAVTDLVAGYAAAVSMLGALWHRRETGEGQFIDCAMLDAAVALTTQYATGYLMTGTVPTRAGNAAPNTYPSGVFQTADVPVMMVCVNDKQFGALCRLIERPDLPVDPLFDTNVRRRDNRVALAAELEPSLRRRGAAEWSMLLGEEGVPCAPINDLGQVFDDPQVRHRGLRIEIPHASGASISVVRSPLRLSETPVVHRSPPMLGQHTATALRERLGLAVDEIDRLRRDGVIAG